MDRYISNPLIWTSTDHLIKQELFRALKSSSVPDKVLKTVHRWGGENFFHMTSGISAMLDGNEIDPFILLILKHWKVNLQDNDVLELLTAFNELNSEKDLNRSISN